MALTAVQYKALIITQVGDTEGGLLAAQMDTLWDLYDVLPVGLVRFYTVKREAISTLMGAYRTAAVDYAIQSDLAEKLNQIMTNLGIMLAETEAALAEARSGRLRGRAPHVGQLTTTAPIASPAGAPDANASRYRGNPSLPTRRVQP